MKDFRNMSMAFTYKVQAREMRRYAALCQEKSSFRVKIYFGVLEFFFLVMQLELRNGCAPV